MSLSGLLCALYASSFKRGYCFRKVVAPLPHLSNLP
jgi:hypothetical protein